MSSTPPPSGAPCTISTCAASSIDLGEEVVNGAFGGDVDETALHQIENAEKKLFELATTGQTEGGFKPFRAALTEATIAAEAAYHRVGQLTGVASGLFQLDQLLGGLHRSDLIILAGRPSMGKTALATNIAFNAARAYREEHGEDGKPKAVDGAVVGFFSLEMSSEQLATRMLCRAGRSAVREDPQGRADQRRFRQGPVGQPDARASATSSSTTRRRSPSPRCAPARAG